jgi:hypothetical protein
MEIPVSTSTDTKVTASTKLLDRIWENAFRAWPTLLRLQQEWGSRATEELQQQIAELQSRPPA